MSAVEPTMLSKRLIPLALAITMFAPSALAHEDLTAAAHVYDVAAGESVSIPVELHYHRLAGQVRVLGDADATVALRVHGPPGEPVRDIARGNAFRVNTVIDCCLDAPWSAHVLEIQNLGERPVRVEADLTLIHGNLAVLAVDAEPGAVVSALVIFGSVTGAAAFVLYRRGPQRTGGAFPWAVASTLVYGLLWVATGAAGLVGTSRFGGGIVAGLLSLPADMPRLGGEFVNTQALMIMGMMMTWGLALLLWAAAARRALADRPHVGRLGLLLGVGAAVSCGLWALEAHAVAVPVMLALTTGALPLVEGFRMTRPASSAVPA